MNKMLEELCDFELDCFFRNLCSSGTKAVLLPLVCIPKIRFLFQNSLICSQASRTLGNIFNMKKFSNLGVENVICL